MPVYQIGKNNVLLLRDVVDTQIEKSYATKSGTEKTKEERLVELNQLLDKKLISPEEYSRARRQIIEGS